jgi:mycothiol synthase
MTRISFHSHLDRDILDEIRELIDVVTAADGHRPVGEHKYVHLTVGASGWTGVLAHEGDRLVGYAHLRWNPLGDRPRLAVEVVVDPAHRDGRIARLLLQETREIVARAGGGLLYLWVHRVEDPRSTLAARLGFRIQRELAFMTARLNGAVPDPDVPAGLQVRPFRPGADDEELLRVNNAAFEGHPENGGWDLAELRGRLDRAWFDPEGLLTAWRDDRLVAFHWTKWHGHDSEEAPAHEPVGEVYVLGVDPAAHGQGLGRAMLRAGMQHLQQRGCRTVILYVDTASTAAVRLYEQEGFHTEYLEVCYAEQIAPAEADSDLLRPA